MKKFIKTFLMVCFFIITLILLTGCGEKTQVSKDQETQKSQENLEKKTEVQTNWKSDTNNVQSAEIILKIKEDMSFSEAEDILYSSSATKDDRFVKGQYKFPDNSTIRLLNKEDTSSIDINISFPESNDKLANKGINFSNYKSINSFGTYNDYSSGFGTNGLLSGKYRLSSGEYIYKYYWIKDSNNYASVNFYKSTGKMFSAQLIIDGKQQSWDN